MTRVIWSVMSTVDGFSAGPGEGYDTIDWTRPDEEWMAYAIELLTGAGVLLFGGTTFAGMEQYWPAERDPLAERMNGLPKIGFSHTVRDTAWSGARVDDDPVGTVTELRRQDLGDAVLLGSARLAGTLVQHGLVDELRFAVHPVLIGAGVPVSPRGAPRVPLDLVGTRVFGSGIVEMRCVPRA